MSAHETRQILVRMPRGEWERFGLVVRELRADGVAPALGLEPFTRDESARGLVLRAGLAVLDPDGEPGAAPAPEGRRWLLNSAVLAAGGYGGYAYEPATRDELAEFLRAGPYESRVGYPETAAAIERWTGIRPALSRETSELAPGDVAMVVRLRYRVDPRAKAGLVPRDEDFEIARLSRLTSAVKAAPGGVS